MTRTGKASGCRYRYNPLDQLTASERLGLVTQRFYRAKQAVTELSATARRSLVQADNQLLALQQWGGASEGSALLASDGHRSVLHAQGAVGQALSYSPYGYRWRTEAQGDLPGFNGEFPESVSGHYLLGDYRLLNSAIMRFHSPDSLSPFRNGGLNPYAYALGDPINHVDPDGHKPISIIAKMLGLGASAEPKASRAIQKIAATSSGSTAASDDALKFGIRLKREPSGLLEHKPGTARSGSPAATHEGPVVSSRPPDWGNQHPVDTMPDEVPRNPLRFVPARPLPRLSTRDPRLRGNTEAIARLEENAHPPAYNNLDIGGGLPSYKEASEKIASIRRS
ncbi:hypothetical protein DCO48_00960 [Pseudomonas sp. SDI]|uniref:RHS repeat-associated core domain-containing protein n=1 Tax=Pseudomonas sp. SDI TaxID=2170734 RepID=UPI000DE6DC9A|nr:RHS repeat-associated core domain-containing protein [Pseudomonas sp. SDI]PWB36048.1 hypothetical protein DCO48_00960 [Pseudomonas sp. SDI]